MIYSAQKLGDLTSLINKIKTKTFGIETQYKFLKILRIATEEQSFVDEQLIILLDNYGEKKESGQVIRNEKGGFKIKEEYLETCAEKIQEINDRQVQFPDIYFSLDELESLGLTLGELELLEPFIK